MAEPRLRRAGPGDDEAIRALLAASYPDNPKVQAAFTRWQYWDNPFGPTHSWVWDDGDRLLCHWSAVAIPLVVDGRPAIGAKGVDIATHPDVRGRGLFGRLARRLLEDLAERDVPALLSHPNARSAALVEAAGARLVSRVGVHVAPTDDAWLARRLGLPEPAGKVVRALVFPVRRGDKASLVDTTPPGIDELWERAGTRYGVRRDSAWWRWRYVQRPERPYRFWEVRRGAVLAAAAVTTARAGYGGRFDYVLELLATDRPAARGLLAAVRADATTRGLAGVALAAAGTPVARMAASSGFRRVPRALEPSPLRFMIAAPGGDSAVLARRPWTMLWGDLDHL